MSESVQPVTPAGSAGGGSLGGQLRAPAGLWSDAWKRLRRNRAAIASLVILALITLAATVGPYVSPYGFDEQNLMQSNKGPSAEHWLGTDRLGQDSLARLLIGARVSLAVAFVAQIVIVLIGLPAGLLAGYFGGWVDNIIMRFVEVLYSIPVLLIVILIMTSLREALERGQGPLVSVLSLADKATGGLIGTIVGISVVAWIVVARLTRAEILSLKEREFVLAARATGVPSGRLMLRHLLPNCLSPIIIAVTYGVPQAIFLEAGLSFLGLGVRPPMASWGLAIAEGSRAIQSYPYLVIPPAVMLALTMVCFTFLGDGLRDALDPKMKR